VAGNAAKGPPDARGLFHLCPRAAYYGLQQAYNLSACGLSIDLAAIRRHFAAGDFFGLYLEANYGRNMDIYNGEAPLGMEFTGKRRLEGLQIALGPELWWGANPTALAKYQIPLLVGRDVIHGFETVLPIPLGQATTWDPELVAHGARIAATEAAAAGVRWTFAPMIDIGRDPRWGRVAEGSGRIRT
jgi:hypothetical protein